MKTILIDDWYAPEFGIRINDPRKCAATLSRRRALPAPFFHRAHAGAGHVPGAPAPARRFGRFAAFVTV